MLLRCQPYTIIAVGYSVAIFLLLLIIIFWVNSVQESSLQNTHIFRKQTESHNLGGMLHAAHLRAIDLYKMSTTEDPFVRDEIYLNFLKLGSVIIKHRMEISPKFFTPNEHIAWKNVKGILNKGQKVQSEVVELIGHGRNRKAYEILIRDLHPNQAQLAINLQTSLNLGHETVTHRLRRTADQKKYTHALMIALAVLTVALGLLSYITFKRSAKTEFELSSHANRMRSLYEVISLNGLSLTERIQSTINVGCSLFDLEIGKLCKIDVLKNINTFVHVVAPEEIGIKAGMIVPLERSFCSIPYSEEKSVMINNVATSKYKKFPCVEFAKLSSYIAVLITVNGVKYGTLNFSSFKAKYKQFSKADEELLFLIGRWIGVSLERELMQKNLVEKTIAQAADAAKSKFLMSMSHEFRTPLNAILGYSDLLIEICEEKEESEIKLDLVKINSSGKHLLSLINNILDLSKIESGKMDTYITPIQIVDLISETADVLSPVLRQNKNKLDIRIEKSVTSINTDGLKLKQILLNVIGNASKFSSDSVIILSVNSFHREGQQWIEVSVSDTGIGMVEEQLSKIFDKFIQAEANTTTIYGGTGLGLSISKKLCQLLHGDIKVSSEYGIGTTFTIVLPDLDIEMPNADLGTYSTRCS